WLDCLNSNAPIPGAEEQSYLVTNTGSYAVEVTEDGCTAVSGCVSVMLLSTPTLSTTMFNLFPNPATDRIEVRSPLAVQRLELFDMSGKFLSGNSRQPDMDLYGLSYGPYFLRITFANSEVRYARITKL
ncbi:MAG: T9SS type A sorting domain-containing protein, partial [Flavobacteriales bacterium]|nr:T9SS type A sorting domain-containing protein [Flavobacteriales bacterium]